jgi:hypothetical protein
MRAYIAVVLLTAGFVTPAAAEAAQPLVNVQQPATERAAQQQRQKAHRRAAAARPSQANPPRTAQDASARTTQSSGPTRIVPASVASPAAPSSSWSNSMLNWWRGESTPAGAGPASGDQVSAEPAAARVEATTTTAEPVKTRRKTRRPKRSESTATGAVPETAPAEVKQEKPARSKRRSAHRGKVRAHQVALRSSASHQAAKPARETPPEPRRKPEMLAKKGAQPDSGEGDSVSSISPAESTGGAQHMAALSRNQDAAGGEATWWQRQGNPVVFNFRDCVASYASREAGQRKDGTWADLLIRATEGDCRAPFDEMARTLAKRFGEARIEPVMRELIDSTFLPAAKQAAASGTPSSEVPPVPAIPDSTPTQ